MNSKEYNDMAIHFKDLMENKELEIALIKNENIDLKKILCMCYTYARQIDEYSNLFIGEDNNNELAQHAEALRGLTSEMLDKYIFNYSSNHS